MFNRRTVIYVYDGSFEGLMCVIFEAFAKKEQPMDIVSEDDYSPSLYGERHIVTDYAHAQRVKKGIKEKMGPLAEKMVRNGFFFDEGGKETAIWNFVRFGLTTGFKKTASMVDTPEVSPLFKMCRAVGSEAHLLNGFTRFDDVGGALVAVITPKHYVLPIIRGNFCARYNNESFLIFDKTHHAALVHTPGKTAIIPIENVDTSFIDSEDNSMYRRLWKEYYKNIAIMDRYNPKCRMTHMPKRFWPNMLEVEDELKERSFLLPDIVNI